MNGLGLGDVTGVVALVVTILGGGTAWVLRWGKIEAAAEIAKEARTEAERCRTELAEFKERAAREFATVTMFVQFEQRVVNAIDRLGDRIDRTIDRHDQSRV